MAHGTPTLATGKICYLEIPAADVERSSRFYRDAFGWELRTRGDGAIAFDDAVKEVSGSWVTGRPPSAEPGIMVHIMVADLEAALAAVRAAGGEVLNDDAAPGERVGHVRDPAGNVIGIYQQPGLAERERTVRPVPEHLHTVTPRLALSDGAAGIDFYKAAFDAKELGERYHMPDGTLVHAELLIGDSVVMVKDAQDDEFNALLCTYWPDVDAAWDRAVRAGAEVIYPLADQFYGERGGRLGDPFGNQWMLAARIETVTPAELATIEPDPPPCHNGHRGGQGGAPVLPDEVRCLSAIPDPRPGATLSLGHGVAAELSRPSWDPFASDAQAASRRNPHSQPRREADTGLEPATFGCAWQQGPTADGRGAGPPRCVA